jgi:pimeloyl-ACP methyl ester carboxylesterase
VIRLALLVLLLSATAPRAETAGRLQSEVGVTRRDAAAAGAVVWLSGFHRDGPPLPPAPDWTARLTQLGFDLWRFDRGAADPLEGGAAALAEGTAALRARGYRRIVLVGHSRGAFIALVALRTPGLADAVILGAPAAHGRNPDRRPEALAAFAAALDAAHPDAAGRLALVLFRDDPWDPDPAQRAALFGAAMQRLGTTALLLDRPAAPVGHGGLHEPELDAIFGACLLAFVAPDAPPATCPDP